MRMCSICNTEKPLDQFHKDKESKEGLTKRCKPCTSAYYKGYNAARKVAEASVDVRSKVCRDCHLEKPISQFGKKNNSLDKHNIYCKPCWRIRCYESMRQNGR
jgi:hypothetical protein